MVARTGAPDRLVGKIRNSYRLAAAGVKTWVNCPRRMQPAYHKLRQDLHGHSPITMRVVGGGWGLACNGIHFLDLAAFLFGREYPLATRLRYFGCMQRSLDRLWDSIQAIDLRTEALRLEVPVVLLIGRADYNTPWELTQDWAQQLSAPHLEVVWFDGVGHFLPIENRDAFQRTLIEKVLPLAS
ncbi:MAG: alpha/beta hydrolase [Oscillatoriales cyanobacterium RU_3_3]|nr:alpha/beta hydrolase [Oscillatoriales cyanobacterium RU_3_3]